MAYPWPPYVRASVEEIEKRFNLTGATYPGHDPSEARAADFWTTSKAKHDEVFKWVIANARRLDILYVISWKRIWSVARASEGIRPYLRYGTSGTPSQMHTNHVHTSYDSTPSTEADMPLSDSDLRKIRDLIRTEAPKAVWGYRTIDPPPSVGAAPGQKWSTGGTLEFVAGKSVEIDKQTEPTEPPPA